MFDRVIQAWQPSNVTCCLRRTAVTVTTCTCQEPVMQSVVLCPPSGFAFFGNQRCFRQRRAMFLMQWFSTHNETGGWEQCVRATDWPVTRLYTAYWTTSGRTLLSFTLLSRLRHVGSHQENESGKLRTSYRSVCRNLCTARRDGSTSVAEALRGLGYTIRCA